MPVMVLLVTSSALRDRLGQFAQSHYDGERDASSRQQRCCDWKRPLLEPGQLQ